MKHFRSCNLCEAICGLEIEHDGQRVRSIKGDKNDPLSRGHICPKAVALKDIHEDPDRLKHPVRRTVGGWEKISWRQAFDEIESRLQPLRRKHGNDAVALYLGNPTVHSLGALTFIGSFKKALATKSLFAATSVDQLPHHFAASLMFGHALLLPVPDIDRSDFILILGANPGASNGSLMTAPGIAGRLEAIRKRGGKVVVVDPRRTETVRLADEHLYIRPGSDVLFLAAMVHVILVQGLDRIGELASWTVNRDAFRDAVQAASPAVAERHTGVPAASIERLAGDFARSKSAVCYGRMGLSTQAHGGLCQWLVNALNIITGNFDRPGGAMFTLPAVDLIGRKSTMGNRGRWTSRVRGLPEFDGELPVSVLAEEMLVEGAGQIRALITHAGNPVLSTPNGRKLETALQGLDFMVSIDIYINETTRHADIILPPATGLEVDHYDLIFNMLAIRNVAKFSPALFVPTADRLHDWQILKELSRRLTPPTDTALGWMKHALWRKFVSRWTPARMLNLGLGIGPYGIWRSWAKLRSGLNLKRLKKSVHGVDLGALRPRAPGILMTKNKKIDLAPPVFVERFREVSSSFLSMQNAEPGMFRLIGRRQLRDNNSWMHNSERLVKGKNRCTVMMHPDDAAPLGFADQEIVRVGSRVGAIDLPLAISNDVMPGVVCIPHGYGHNRPGTRLATAEAHGGESVNDITDDQVIDELTGNAAFSGQWVRVSAVPAESLERKGI